MNTINGTLIERFANSLDIVKKSHGVRRQVHLADLCDTLRKMKTADEIQRAKTLLKDLPEGVVASITAQMESAMESVERELANLSLVRSFLQSETCQPALPLPDPSARLAAQ